MVFLAAFPLVAEEGGGGHAAPGGVATLIDAAPTTPGWVIEPIYVNYQGDFKASKSLPIGGVVSLGLDAKVDTLTIGALQTFEQKVWGASYSVGIFVPYAWMDITGNVGNLEVSDNVEGIGDITFIPAMMTWKNEAWQYTATLSIYAPTGNYNAGSLANLGLNYWTVEPSIGAAYSDEETGLNFGVYAGVTVNSKNRATNYQSGTMFHIESSIQQLFPLGKGYLAVGLDAFWFQQITGDSGSGAASSFKGRTMGVGPVLGYILPDGDNNLVVEAKWLPETNTENRLEGEYFWLKLVYQF